MKYVLINDEGLDLGNKNLVELETIEVTADDPTSAVLTILGEQKRRLIVTKYGRAPGVWLVRDDDKEAYGLSLIVVERSLENGSAKDRL